jgi:hypothetical protein
MKPQRIRLIEPGWETYTGHLIGWEFVNGLSALPVPPVMAQQIGTALRVEAVDDGAQVGAGVTMQDNLHRGAEVTPELPRQSDEAMNAPTEPVAEPTPTPKSVTFYSRAELEAIADRSGITGLRQIADTLGVRGRGIVELIREIGEAQDRLRAAM